MLNTTIKNHHNRKHGLSKTPLYEVWCLMMRRCYRPHKPDYKYYGGRGITVCDQWHSVETFVDWAKNNGYEAGLQIDRYPNMNGNYTPDNVRFVSSKVNNNNRRDNRLISFGGKTQTLQQWADETGIETSKIRARIDRLRWSIDKALTHAKL